MSAILPLGARVLVRIPDPPPGVLVAEPEDSLKSGVVVAAGNGPWAMGGVRPLEVCRGDLVFYRHREAAMVVGGAEMDLVREEHLLCITPGAT